MSTQVVKDGRAGAEVYHGSEMCKQKALQLLEEMGLPRGLLPLHGLEECGYVKATGFVWLKRKKKLEHRFKTTGKLVSYAPEVTAYVEKYKMKNVSGVKAKELRMWIPLTDMTIDDPSTQMIYCKSALGIGMSFPVQAFETEYENYEK
eukprot:Gb_40920 [translate_table: standard]